MKSLLKNIKTRLTSKLEWMKPDCIFITPDAEYIPASVRPPCIGIKDGDIRRTPEPGTGTFRRESREVHIIIWSDLIREETAIIGDSVLGEKGLAEAAEEVDAALDGYLADETVGDAWCKLEKGTEQFSDGHNIIQRKILTFEYETNGARPGER